MAHPAASESRDSAGALAGNSTPSAARTPVGLTALTRHDDFLLELGEVLGGRAAVHPAESIDAALDQLDAGRGGQILAIDARENDSVRADVERASDRSPRAVILVFTEAGAEKAAAATVKGTKVFAVLPLPMELDKTAAVLDAALTDALERAAPAHRTSGRPSREAAPTRVSHPAAAAIEPGDPEPRSSGRRPLVWAAIGAGTLIAAGATVLLMPRHHAALPHAASHHPEPHSHGAVHEQAGSLPAPAVDTSIVRGRVEDLLEKASRAMFARRFTSPKGANALVYYRSVLAVDPTNGEARNGLLRVSHVLISRFHDAMAQAHYSAAALALATLRLAEPTDAHVRPFGIELSNALVGQALQNGPLGTVPALIAQAARRGVPAAQIAAWRSTLKGLQHTHKIQTIAQQIARRIAANRLTGTASAASAFARLRTLAPAAPATDSAAQALIGALLSQARQAGLADHGAAENQWLAAARAAGASAQTLAATRQRITHERTQTTAQDRIEQLLAKARARLAAGALVRPQRGSAAFYLSTIAAHHPDSGEAAAADRVRRALAHALVVRAEAAARAGQRGAARRDLAAARRWGARGDALQAAAVLAAAPAGPTAAQLAEVAQHLRRTHYVAPVYPQQALADRISGEVIVQYVVDKSGRTRGLQVVTARPSGVFDRAALAAIGHWRYTPPKFRGEPVDVPVRTAIRFVLPK